MCLTEDKKNLPKYSDPVGSIMHPKDGKVKMWRK